MAALIIVLLIALLWRDFQLRQARKELASRRVPVEAALMQGFRLGMSLRDEDPSEDAEAGDRVPTGAGPGGARCS